MFLEVVANQSHVIFETVGLRGWEWSDRHGGFRFPTLIQKWPSVDLLKLRTSFLSLHSTPNGRGGPEGPRPLSTPINHVTSPYIIHPTLDLATPLACIIIRLEARLQPNIGFTLRRVLAVFTLSAITPPKMNRFGLNLEHSEYIVGAGPGRFWTRSRSSDSWRARRNFFVR